MSGRGFFSRMIGGEGGEDETRIYSADELETSKRLPRVKSSKRSISRRTALRPSGLRRSSMICRRRFHGRARSASSAGRSKPPG
jgi:hypothetical protein